MQSRDNNCRIAHATHIVHFHCCVTDGLFSAEAEGVKFHGIEAIAEKDLQRIQQTLRRCLIRLFKRRGLLEPELAQDLLSWVSRYTDKPPFMRG
jgi:hypothetical protein